MPDKVEYVGAQGFVQFDVNERDVNGQTVRDVVVKNAGKPINIRITLWPEFEDVDVQKGDFVAVEGKFTRNTYQAQDGTNKESLQISASSLYVGKPAVRKERSVANASSQDADPDLF